MSSYPMRDPKTDHLLTPQNAAFVLIDYQPIQVSSIESMNKTRLVSNITVLSKMVKAYGLPIVVSTVNVETGLNKPMLRPLREVFGGIEPLDRTTINAWEDKEVREAIVATGRKKLIICALWTEACLTYPALDAIKEGYEVYTIVDAIGGTSVLAHEMALRRIEQAGAKLCSIGQLGCELQRDWNRPETAQIMVDAFLATGIFPQGE
ncbi:hydrolase [Mucilaginibacter sp. L3T2-6]|uniref:hydrolase n=1 Tax=Mucilaginibacter sp. L3T2-6 TaxID=3062491 RepID=UPI0026756D94|nr:hydrolase [Mucilaginibacter sp. L3T2-6]MDO3645133.1 hydrolase [Mucilaginibacter sp. L3T2-6]MDV6217585.1 hydrolase [Mucilaginibacter sp. L3T2-6]